MFLIVAALFVQSCHDNDKTPEATRLEVYKDSVSIDALSFQVSSGYYIIGINADADWTASVSDTSWVTISNHAGYGYSDHWSFMRVDVARNLDEARTAQLVIQSGSLSKTITISQAGTGLDPGDPFESAYTFIHNLKLGYNLGNTLDACPSGSWWDQKAPHSVSDWETSWGQPVTTPEIINAIAERGFNVIRVPVTWYVHADENDVIDTEWMNRVEEVVNYVLDAGCYCIINVMHDTGSDGWLRADIDDYPTSTVRFQKFWQQIANRFRNYDDRLLFEAFNEILDNASEWGNPSKSSAYEAINRYEQDFVNTVRATGGNNEYRNLIITTYGAGSTAEKLAGLSVPTDKHPNHILGSVHTYDPYNFCNDNGQYNISVFDSSCEEEVAAVVNRTANRFDQLGIPFIFGEFGAIDEDKTMSERIKYARYVVKQMQARGTTGLWWMGLINRNNLTWYEDEIVSALFESLN